MTLARKHLISISDTTYYHIICRCVRRAFLCGHDSETNRCYEHRRQWIVDRVAHLAIIFSIDVCAYAVMNNHYHLVLKVGTTADWSDHQVLTTWGALCRLPSHCQRYLKGDNIKGFELKLVQRFVAIYRERLMNISWFMRFLNQHIAVAANKEDHCTGHFWESRFKSQALLDERALLTCMAYVDLNPIRAAIAKSPKSSDFTSIQERIHTSKTALTAFGQGMDDIPYSLTDYLALVVYTGRAILNNKRGFIPTELEPILLRLNLDKDHWLKELQQFSSKGITAVGTVQQLKAFCQSVGKKWSIGHILSPALE